jgi:adenosylhomocysteine nucleosidase
MRIQKLGILSAMEEETWALEHTLEEAKQVSRGRTTFHQGELLGFPVVLGRSGWGKVAAASHTQSMIDFFGVDAMLFIGVAGGLSPQIRRGDIIVATGVAQHDMDARPFFAQGEIPLLGVRELMAETSLLENAYQACMRVIQESSFSPEELAELGMAELTVHQGLALTGDQIIFDPVKKSELLKLFPSALSVDMESAAVGQVCHSQEIPFAVVRIISDNADHQMEDDFLDFMKRFVDRFTGPVVRNFIQTLKQG